jgi:phage terminase large subunit GpA-like protein
MLMVGLLAQALKSLLHGGRNWRRLNPGEQEALDMICHKLARIMCGADPHDHEHWEDVAGYAIAARRGDAERAPKTDNPPINPHPHGGRMVGTED